MRCYAMLKVKMRAISFFGLGRVGLTTAACLASKGFKVIGFDDLGRLRLEWISSAEGTRFAEVAREFTEEIKTLGPSTLKKAA